MESKQSSLVSSAQIRALQSPTVINIDGLKTFRSTDLTAPKWLVNLIAIFSAFDLAFLDPVKITPFSKPNINFAPTIGPKFRHETPIAWSMFGSFGFSKSIMRISVGCWRCRVSHHIAQPSVDVEKNSVLLFDGNHFTAFANSLKN